MQSIKTIFQLPGEAGILQTIHEMKGLVNRSYYHPLIRDRAAKLVAFCKRDMKCDHANLLNWVTSNFNYVRDPTGIEAITDPLTIERDIRNGNMVQGDCDDMVTYLASLLKAVGHRPRFRVMGRNKTLHHVAIICENETHDPTLGLGIIPRNPGRALQFPI